MNKIIQLHTASELGVKLKLSTTTKYWIIASIWLEVLEIIVKRKKSLQLEERQSFFSEAKYPPKSGEGSYSCLCWEEDTGYEHKVAPSNKVTIPVEELLAGSFRWGKNFNTGLCAEWQYAQIKRDSALRKINILSLTPFQSGLGKERET